MRLRDEARREHKSVADNSAADQHKVQRGFHLHILGNFKVSPVLCSEKGLACATGATDVTLYVASTGGEV